MAAVLLSGERQELSFATTAGSAPSHTRRVLQSVVVDDQNLDPAVVMRLWEDGEIKLIEPAEGGLERAWFVGARSA